MSLPNLSERESLFSSILRENVDQETWARLQAKATLIHTEQGSKELFSSFSSMPRITGRLPVRLSKEQQSALSMQLEGLTMEGWTVDRLARVWLLQFADASDETGYRKKIESLFTGAEMNELAALYASLPFLAYPEAWTFKCTEGIRSNIGYVLEAIMYENPYPARYLDEPAWNQLVLKAFFTDKQVDRIIGLDERANAALAAVLVDYAHERWAAHRQVNPQLWRLVANFIDEASLQDISRLFHGQNPVEKKAAALAFSQTNFAPAQALLAEAPDLINEIKEKRLSWHSLARETINS